MYKLCNYTFLMTLFSKPLDIAVNKIFKDHIKLLFEKERLFYYNILSNMKLDKAIINLLNYINNVWNNQRRIYRFCLNNNLEIVNDLVEKYNLEMNENELSLEEATDELLDNEKRIIENKEYQFGNDYKNEISNLEGNFEFNNIE